MKTADTYHHGHLRAELIRRGLEALEAEGADQLSLRLLAEKAGVSKTAPYRHFRDRDEFLGALADEGFRLLHLELEVFAKEGPPGVPAMGRAYMGFAVAHPALYRLMNSPLVCAMPEGSMLWARRSLMLLGQTLASGSTTDPAATDNGGVLDFDKNGVAATWAYIHGLVLLRIDGLFPADLPAPDWDLLASSVPHFSNKTRSGGSSGSILG